MSQNGTLKTGNLKTFDKHESKVRGYCRSFPTVFTKAHGHTLIDEQGKEFIDFFAGAGALNYGHNHPLLKQKLIDYLASDGVTHSLDMATTAKRNFIDTFQEKILSPRKMNYKMMFPGPTGTNAVEAAVKLARKVTGRTNVIAFTNGFHGMTLGSLALTGNAMKRAGAGVSLQNSTHMPFCGYFGMDTDTIDVLEAYLENSSSGLEAPAAFILETVQAEGGVNVASREWLKRMAALARKYCALLVVDDIQVGCGRTGSFFSFESAGVSPDIICLSKSLSGYGLPLAVTLMRPELDQWTPGEHNGTFRGHNPAFITATAAMETFWSNSDLTHKVNEDAAHVRDRLFALTENMDAEVRGRGMIQGIEFADKALAGEVSQAAFQRGLIIETAGPADEVLKLLPPLTISREALDRGLTIIEQCVREAIAKNPPPARVSVSV